MGRTISGLILLAVTVSSLGAMQAPRSVLEKLRDIRSVPPDLVIPNTRTLLVAVDCSGERRQRTKPRAEECNLAVLTPLDFDASTTFCRTFDIAGEMRAP